MYVQKKIIQGDNEKIVLLFIDFVVFFQIVLLITSREGKSPLVLSLQTPMYEHKIYTIPVLDGL